MVMMMPRNRYISDTVGSHHLYLAFGGFCCTYTFVCLTIISMMSLPNVTLKSPILFVAVLGIAMAGPAGPLRGVTGSVEEPLVQEVTRESRVGCFGVGACGFVVSCESSESSSAMVASSACWRGSYEMVPSTE